MKTIAEIKKALDEAISAIEAIDHMDSRLTPIQDKAAASVEKLRYAVDAWKEEILNPDPVTVQSVSKIRQVEGTEDDLPCAGNFDVTLITDAGSYISTQIWTNPNQRNTRMSVAEYILEKLAEGNDKNDTWNHPVIHAFIKPQALKVCFHFDLRKNDHVAKLAVYIFTA